MGTYYIGNHILGKSILESGSEILEKTTEEEAIAACQGMIHDFDDTANDVVDVKLTAQGTFKHQIGSTIFWIALETSDFSDGEENQMSFEGWSIFFAPWSLGDNYQLQKILGSAFNDDKDVQQFVRQQAEAKSALHVKAMDFLKKWAPNEYAKITG